MSKEKLIPKLRFPEFSENWEIKLLSDICDVYRGGTFSKADMNENGLNPCIHYGELFTKYNEVITTIYSKTNKNEGFKSEVGDVLMPSSDVTPDGLAKASAIMLDNVVLGGDMNILRPRKTFDSIFLTYLLNHSKKEIIKLVSGTTVKHIYPSQIITCPLPIVNNKSEQQKIASCLSSLDELIAAHNQKLVLLKDHKKGLMQNLFPHPSTSSGSGTVAEPAEAKVPKYRFKEFEKDGEWELKQLGVDNLIEIKGRIGYRGYTTEDIVNKGEGAISMSPSNIDENWNLNYEKSTYITWDKYEESPEIMLEDGFTVLVKTGSSYGKAAYVKNLIEKTTINPQLVVLKPEKIDSYFLYLLVTNTSIQKQIQETVVGGAIPTLSQDSISKFEVLVPKKKEQDKIADCLLTLNQLIISQTVKIEQLKLHKKGLMQGLFPKLSEL